MMNFPPPPLFPQPSSPSFSSLPDEIVESFLARISISYYRSLSLVSKSFYSLVSCRKIFTVRSQIGATEPCLYVCLWLPKNRSWIYQKKRREKNHSWFTLINPVEAHIDQVEGLLRREPVRISSSNDPARLNSTSVTVGFEIYQIGGTVGDKRSKAVDVLDCRSHTWRRAPDLTVARESAKSCFLDGKIYVTGGEEESMNWGEVFDIKSQTWKPLPSPSDTGLDPSDHQVVVLGGRLCVITKHKNKYAYDPKEGSWLPDTGFLGSVEPLLTEPCCFIDNVLIVERGGKFKWYDSSNGDWLMVEGLEDLYAKRCLVEDRMVRLVNHGGKLVIIWNQWKWLPYSDFRPPYINIWCAVIRLEQRVTPFGTQLRGDIERCNVVVYDVHKSYQLLSCQSVSI
ncbi:hypothetical protein EUTSA_v10025393mg [Eutrema salsugineum]|uniref:F-box domain-containing protein n=1 Tax=Eutrema salsugineum TaxID=72664 RepID=V4P2L8_EUTSA|nr:putative F-box/kelch-repeat protein At4g35120 [Eutrema salsugineum]ESQ53596.1 hypothetical protein EUTSA_v10025393mg [Eutrema salsugineum]